MKRLTQWSAAAGLMAVATAAHAQTVMPVSDFGGHGPYAAAAEARWPGYGPRLLAPAEVTAVLREHGFAQLGSPQQRGIVYTVSAIDPAGDDGKLVIDARSGRIIRFLPAWRMGNRFNETLDFDYGPVGPLPPLPASTRRGARPPLPIPHVASRTAPPLPKPPPYAAPAQQSAQAPPVAVPAEAKPATQFSRRSKCPRRRGWIDLTAAPRRLDPLRIAPLSDAVQFRFKSSTRRGSRGVCRQKPRGFCAFAAPGPAFPDKSWFGGDAEPESIC